MQNRVNHDSGLYKEIFNHITKFVVALEPDGTIIEANQAAIDLGGFERSSVIGQILWESGWWQLLPKTQAEIKAAIQQAARGEPVKLEVEIMDKDQTLHILDFRIHPVLDDGRLVKALVAEGRDTTDRKQAERTLIVRDTLLQSVISAAPIGLVLIDAGGNILYSGGKGRESLRVTRGEGAGRSIYQTYWDTPSVINSFERALKGEAFYIRNDIDGRSFEVYYAPYHDASGEVAGVLGVATDITSRLQVEDALYSSQARFQTIFEQAAIGIALEDLDGRVIEANPAFQAMLGYSAAELYQRKFQDFTHPDDLSVNVPLYRSLISKERQSFRLEKRYIRKDGQIVWGLLTTSKVEGPDGKTHAVIAMVEDITSRKQMEAELIEVQRRLMQSLEMERLRIAQDIHDGPIQELYGVGFKLKEIKDQLEDQATLDLTREIEDTILQQSRVLRMICGDLRPPALAPFGLETAIRSHAEAFEKAHPQIKIKLDLSPDHQELPEQVRLTLFRIYQELCNNIKRHSQATQIYIHFSLEPDEIILELEDNGKGFTIPGRWVELARQGHLGLVGAQERAETIGGRLEIRSAPGEGTRVRVIAPREGYDHTGVSIPVKRTSLPSLEGISD